MKQPVRGLFVQRIQALHPFGAYAKIRSRRILQPRKEQNAVCFFFFFIRLRRLKMTAHLIRRDVGNAEFR